jgi:toxin-antitoxin system PIN domain toxin
MEEASSDLLLVDVNVLLAIALPNHQFHNAAVAVLSSRARWATCALTQLGFVRLSSNPAVVTTPKRPQEAARLLARLVGDPLHVYLDVLPAPASEEWRDVFAALLGHRQVTDAYLLGLAAANHAIFVTLDRRLESMAGGKARVSVLTDIPQREDDTDNRQEH